MKLFSVQRFAAKLPAALLCFFALTTVFGAAGDLDPTFYASAYNAGTNETVNIIKKQPDGKYLVGGKFIKVNGFAAPGLVRLNADFTVDVNFNPPEFTDLANQGEVIGLGIQSDGKIIVVTNIPLMPARGRRILPDGALDSAFSEMGFGYLSASDVDILPGDKILAGGQLFNANGTRDNSYPGLISGGFSTAFQTDGKILAGTSAFRRYNADGSVDNSFQIVNTNGTVV